MNSADFELGTQSVSPQKASKAGKYYGTMTTTVHEGGSASDNGGSYNYYNGSASYSTGSYKVTASSGLFVRTGPGTNYDKAGGLSYGTVVDITQTSGNWGKCSSGWICLSYASKVSSGSSGGLSYYNASVSYKTGYYTVTTRAGVNVRSSYGANSSKITAIPYGTQIAVEETNGNWGRYSRGWVCLDYTRYDGPVVPPVPVPDAPSLGLYSGADFAVGKAVTVKWEPAANAEVYDIWLKNSAGTVCQEIIGTNNNSASFTVNDAGTYYITAQSRNSEHASSASNSIKVTAHAPSTVTFADWDGTTISEQKVGYGETASAPTVPTRKGYTFSGWKGDFYTVKSDVTITAEYVKNVYFVSFLDEGGSLIGAKQRVEYGESASAPEYTAPEGYTFISWDKEFDFVESDLTIRPVNKWANENLPIQVLSTSTAVRESGGYTVNVKIRNGSTNIKNGRIILK